MIETPLDTGLQVGRQWDGALNSGLVAGMLEFHQPPKVRQESHGAPAIGFED